MAGPVYNLLPLIKPPTILEPSQANANANLIIELINAYISGLSIVGPSVSDGTTTVPNAGSITFDGAVVSGTTPDAVVSISGSSGSHEAASIAALRLITPQTFGLFVTSYSGVAGSFVGNWYYPSIGVPPGTWHDNGTTVILPNGGDGSAAWLLPNSQLVTAPPATGVAATDTANLQAAINTALFNISKSASAQGSGQSVLFIPGGTYVISTPLILTSAVGLRMVGAGRFSTTIYNPNGTGIIKANGFQYSSIESMTLNGISISDSAPVLDIDWDGTGLSSQSNTFKDLYIQNTSCGVRLGNSGFQVSENIFIDCGFTLCANGILTQNFNVLDNVVLGGNFLLCGIGINMFKGAVEVIQGVGFQLSSVVDIFFQNSAYDQISIIGCRTESANFLSLLRGSAKVISCDQPNKTGVFAEGNGYGTISLDTCTCGGILEGTGANGLCRFTVDNCQFNAPASGAFGNPGAAVDIRNTYVNGLIDDNPSATFIPNGYYAAGQSYIPVQMPVSSSQTLGGPGTYLVTVTGVTLALPAGVPTTIPGNPVWTIKDGTGSASPNITVVATSGTIDGAASLVINNPGWSYDFNPFQGGNAWLSK